MRLLRPGEAQIDFDVQSSVSSRCEIVRVKNFSGANRWIREQKWSS